MPDYNVTVAMGGMPLDSGVYNVMAYGAAGDGSTDDTTAIQSAIDAASAAGGGRVHLPGRTFIAGTASAPASGRFSGGNGCFLKLKPGVSISGIGESSVIKVADAAGDYTSIFMQDEDDTADTANRLEGVTISDLCIDHNRTNKHTSEPGSTTNPRYSVMVTWSRGFTADNIVVKDFDGVVSMHISNLVPTEDNGFENEDATVTNCRWIDAGGSTYNYDVSIVNAYSNGLSITNNKFHVYDQTKYGARTALDIRSTGSLVCTGNYIDGCELGIIGFGNTITPAEDQIIAHNNMVNVRAGIYLEAKEWISHTTGTGTDGLKVVDNNIRISPLFPAVAGVRSGIYVSNSSAAKLIMKNIEISRNIIVFEDPSTALMNEMSDGIALYTNAAYDEDVLIDGLEVKDNFIRGAYVAGIKSWGNIQNAEFSGNIIIDPSTGDKTANSGLGAGLWCGIRYLKGDTASNNSTDVYFKDNTIIVGSGAPNYGAYFSIDAGDAPFVWRGNTLSGTFATADYVGTTNVTFDGMLLDELKAVGFYTYAGSPDTNVTAGKGSLCSDTTNGALYINTDGATAWALV